MLVKIALKIYRLLPARLAYLIKRALPRRLELALKLRTRPDGGPLGRQLSEKFDVFKTDHLKAISGPAFRSHIESQLGIVDAAAEGFTDDDVDRQRDLSIKFYWGHDHDFGDFRLEGRMGDRHITVMADFCSLFQLSPADFEGKDVLDVGCWTGGTSLLLAAHGSRVVALEEVKKYADMTSFLAESFGLEEQLEVIPLSLYACNDDPRFYDRFDVAYFAGTLNNVSDPVVALRILYNACRMGGIILVESAGISSENPICRFDGSYVYNKVPGETRKRLNRSGWSWFYPSPSALERMLVEAGFDETETTFHNGRLYGYGKKVSQVGVCRAGLSVPDIR